METLILRDLHPKKSTLTAYIPSLEKWEVGFKTTRKKLNVCCVMVRWKGQQLLDFNDPMQGFNRWTHKKF
ncbi:MAG: hypothetical protein V2A69_13290, partial [Pseudomonadota bacterium]